MAGETDVEWLDAVSNEQKTETTATSTPAQESATQEAEVKQEAEPSPAAGEPKPEPHESEDAYRKRINKLVWQREENRREAEYWKRKAQETQTTAKPEPANPVADPTKPRVDQYQTFEEFTEALADWKVTQHVQKAKEEFQKQTQAQKRSEAVNTFRERADKIKDKYPDFDEAFEQAIISEAMADPILESEAGPEIAMYLARNPDIAKRLSHLPPVSAAREIGKIEAKLDDLMKTKVASDAAAPLNPVKPKGEIPSGLDDKLDIKTWMQRRNKQLGR